MTTRYTAKDVEEAFERLALAFGLPTKGSTREPGTYSLDSWHGYKIIEYRENGGEAEPFGAHRYTANEFVHAVGFAIDALYQPQKER